MNLGSIETDRNINTKETPFLHSGQVFFPILMIQF